LIDDSQFNRVGHVFGSDWIVSLAESSVTGSTLFLSYGLGDCFGGVITETTSLGRVEVVGLGSGHKFRKQLWTGTADKSLFSGQIAASQLVQFLIVLTDIAMMAQFGGFSLGAGLLINSFYIVI
jgi:hypothetical protein